MRKLALILPFLLSGCFDYSDGDRAGSVTKLSKKGLFCKTWEGSMNLGGMRKETVSSSDGKSFTEQTVPNTFDFTVEDLSLLPKIQAAMNTGERITVHYKQELFTFCRSDSNYFIDAIN